MYIARKKVDMMRQGFVPYRNPRSPRLMERFMARVEVRSDGHWLWTAGKLRRNPDRLPKFSTPLGQVQARRWIWEQTHGPVPEGFVVQGVCGELMCVRPDCSRLVRSGLQGH
jgi:hypothetical protein